MRRLDSRGASRYGIALSSGSIDWAFFGTSASVIGRSSGTGSTPRGVMIEVAGLTKMYGQRAALGGISFSVSKGEIAGFLGPNGAGKTSTMRMLTGYVTPTAGTARVAGFDVQDAPIEAKRRIGYLPEHPPRYKEMIVRPFLRFVGSARGVLRKDGASRVARASDRCGLGPVAGRLIGNRSKGYQQRVGL